MEMSSAGNAQAVLQQVSQLWSMMDDLSLNDPAAYRSFIGRMRAEAGCSAPPPPPQIHSSLRTEIQEPEKGLLYINICSWRRVPAPQDPSKPIPVFAGKLATHTDEGQYTVLDVALNPAVLKESKRDRAGVNQVCMLALNFAQQQYGLRLSSQYTIVSQCPKSSLDDLHFRFGFQQRSDAVSQPDAVCQTPADLLQQISLQSSEKQDRAPATPVICGPAGHKKTTNKKDLIQVISATYVPPQKPEYRLQVMTDAAGAPCKVEVMVELPKVGSMSECRLSVSKEDVLLEVEDVYYLLLDLPRAVNEDTASAIFNKQTRRLTLRVDTL